MPRKSFKSLWISLALTVALAGVTSLVATPTASASPAHALSRLHAATQLHAAKRNAAALVSSCGSGYTTLITLNNSVFNNYSQPTCDNWDVCGMGSPVLIYSIVCLYQNSNYGGQEIAFTGNGCANLTQFAGPGPNGTWNDTMSSFRWWESGDTNTQVNAFWWNTNDSGYYYLFGPGYTTQTSYIGNTWNDQASSLNINIKPSGC